MTKSRRGGKSYMTDMQWAKAELEAGRKVWCVRTRMGGLIVTMMSTKDAPDFFKSFDGEPLENFTITPITLHNGEPVWGTEQLWPGTGEAEARDARVEEGLTQTDLIGDGHTFLGRFQATESEH